MQTPVLQALDLRRTYHTGGGEVHAVDGVNLTVESGTLVALTGRSGSGKTTLINLLGGLDRPTVGQVFIDGIDLSKLNDRQMTRLRRDRLGFIFQSYGLIPTLSAHENAELPLHLMGWKWKRRQERVMEALALVSIDERAAHRVYELSGGEQQRVAIARALAPNPGLILADEPTGSLDSATAASIWKLLATIAHEQGVAVITATHDPSVQEWADRWINMQDGQLAEQERVAAGA